MGMEKIEDIIKSHTEKPNEKDKLMQISFLGLSTGELSCCRGMLAKLAEDRAEYAEVVGNILKKYSENTIRNDKKRHELYLCVSKSGKELTTKLSIEKIKRILNLKKRDIIQYEKVLQLLDEDGMTKEVLYDYLNENIKKEESVYLKKNEILKPIADFVKKAGHIGVSKFSNSLNAMIKSVGIQLLDVLSIWEKTPDVFELKKILKNKSGYLDVSTGIYL